MKQPIRTRLGMMGLLGTALITVSDNYAAKAVPRAMTHAPTKTTPSTNATGNAEELVNLLGKYQPSSPTEKLAYLQRLLDTGNQSKLTGNFQLATKMYQEMLRLDPGCIPALMNTADMLLKFGKNEHALKIYAAITQSRPTDPRIGMLTGRELLRSGKFEEGLKGCTCKYELIPKQMSHLDRTKIWNGRGELKGKTVLLTMRGAESAGDIFWLARYTKVIADRGAKVILEVPPELVEVMELCQGASRVVAIDGSECKIQTQCHYIMPFETCIGLLTKTPDKIPNNVPYFSAGIARTNLELPPKKKTSDLKVGLFWKNSYAEGSDQIQKSEKAYRSLSLKFLDKLFAIDGISWYSLQKFGGNEEIALFGLDNSIYKLPPEFDQNGCRFIDTLAWINQMDVVVGIDSAVTHLAAATGKKTIFLVSQPGDPKWTTEKINTRWYPNAVLFRQSKPGIWDDLIATAASELRKMAFGYKE